MRYWLEVTSVGAGGVLALVGPHKYGEAHNRCTRGVFGYRVGSHGRRGSSWYTGCIG